MMSHLCNRYVCEFLILARTWFAFGLPSKTGCHTLGEDAVGTGDDTTSEVLPSTDDLTAEVRIRFAVCP
jgi:hypothetical protein